MFPEKIKKIFTPQILEVFLYTAGCGFSLVLKVILTTVIGWAGFSFWIAYFMTHVILLFCSFFYHHCVTFRKKFESFSRTVREFLDFSAAVIVLKLLDYFLVSTGIVFLTRYILPADASVCVRQLMQAGTIICISGAVFVLRYFIYRILFKKPPVEYYTGSDVKQVFLAHAADPEISGQAASGGTVTALLLSMLETRQIDGALVTVSDFSLPKEKRFHTVIARNAGELRRSQGSIYCDFRYLSAEILEELKQFEGKIAVVGLPCQLRQIDAVCEKHPEIAGKIVLKIGLFCGHTSQSELLDLVLEKKNVRQEDIGSFRFRCGKWRGNARAVLKNGEVMQWPTAYYNLYQNLFVTAPQRCLCCFDHFAEKADISTGDVWSQKYRFAAVKPSMTAVRTEQGMKYFSAAVEAGKITACEKSLKDLFAANSRSAVFHKAIAARSQIFSRHGIEIPIPEGAKPARWNEKLAVKIIAAFYTRPAGNVLKMNRRFLKFCLYVMKGLTSF